MFTASEKTTAVVADLGLTPAQRYFQNPVLPGFFPDPSLVRVGEDYYLVNSTFQYFPGIVISHSRDLVHWKQIGHVFTRSEELDLSGFFDGCGVWAPDISYHAGEFYIFYCLVQLTKDRTVNVRGNYMVKSSHILGPYSSPVQLTGEGNDPSHFIDDDGRHYLLYAAGVPQGRGTRIARLNDDCTKVIEGPFWIDYGPQKRAPEGPHLFKRNGFYYHTIAASGGAYDGHHQLIARSRSILGPYEPSPHGCLLVESSPDATITHQGHAKFVQTQNNEWWVAYLCQRRVNGFAQLGRETSIDRIDWLADDWPVVNRGHGPSTGGIAPDLPEFRVTRSAIDHFETSTLDSRWQVVRNPQWEGMSLTQRPGHLRLYTQPADLNSMAHRNLVLQRETSHRFIAATSLDFSPISSEQAGLACYYDSTCYIKFFLTRTDGLLLRLEECRRGTRKTIAEKKLSDDGVLAAPLFLRVQVEGFHREFSYSLDHPTSEQRWNIVGQIDDCHYLSDQGTGEWGFTGTMVGLFAAGLLSQRRTAADFDWFELRNLHAPAGDDR